MNHYSVPVDQETLAALYELRSGVISAATFKDFPHFAQCSAICLELADGRWIALQAQGEDLEFKFEVFALQARIAERPGHMEHHSIELAAPVTVTPLLTESWLDPSLPTGPTIGSDPIVQCVGVSGSAPATASATCRYLGGVELKAADGSALVVATGGFPYTLHVTGLSEDSGFSRSDYSALPAEA